LSIFKLPLSGNVPVTVAPWTAFLSPFNNQFGLINISLGRSSAPEVEEEVLDSVGSYGRQLGRMGDALTVLLDHFKPERPLSRAEKKAIRALRDMLEDIDDIKRKRGRHPQLERSAE